MRKISTFQTSSICAVAKAAAFSFVVSVTQLYAQAPVMDKSAGSANTVSVPNIAPNAGGAKLAPATAPPATTVVPQKIFVSIGDRPAVMFDAPSNRTNKNFIIFRNTPLELLVKLDKMTKVRDAEGSIGWVENELLGSRRHVQVTATSTDVRSSPSATATLAFDVQRLVLLEVTGSATQDGWIPVKHRDGQTGFVRLTDVWGD